MEDHFQTPKSWWKQKFQQLEALFQGQSTRVVPPSAPNAHAIQRQSYVQATQPEPTSRALELEFNPCSPM